MSVDVIRESPGRLVLRVPPDRARRGVTLAVAVVVTTATLVAIGLFTDIRAIALFAVLVAVPLLAASTLAITRARRVVVIDGGAKLVREHFGVPERPTRLVRADRIRELRCTPTSVHLALDTGEVYRLADEMPTERAARDLADEVRRVLSLTV